MLRVFVKPLALGLCLASALTFVPFKKVEAGWLGRIGRGALTGVGIGAGLYAADKIFNREKPAEAAPQQIYVMPPSAGQPASSTEEPATNNTDSSLKRLPDYILPLERTENGFLILDTRSGTCYDTGAAKRVPCP